MRYTPILGQRNTHFCSGYNSFSGLAIVHFIRRLVPKRLMRPLAVVILHPLPRHLPQLLQPHPIPQIHTLPLQAPPEPLYQKVIPESPAAHADANPSILKQSSKALTYKLTTLIRMHHLRFAISAKGFPGRFYTYLHSSMVLLILV